MHAGCLESMRFVKASSDPDLGILAISTEDNGRIPPGDIETQMQFIKLRAPFLDAIKMVYRPTVAPTFIISDKLGAKRLCPCRL